jgi:hypothetical protein
MVVPSRRSAHQEAVGLGTVAVFVAFLLYGAVVGALTMQSWTDRNGETAPPLLIVNALGVYLGDEVYVRSIDLIGDPSSDRAHFSIPWVLRLPYVYVASSALSWGLVGLLVGWVTSIARRR